jgi:NADPH-dependent 2,4-dienoyl-CoA reductase/sulfur reductase-like enzyme
MKNHDVIIIGAGPAGLAAATRLHELGVKDVVVLEREGAAGGAARFCNHVGFGWQSHRKLMTGPKFAATLCNAAKHIDIRTSTTVLEFTMRNTLRVHTSTGIADMTAKRIMLATGAHESSRAALLIGGNDLAGILNTATLQQLVYSKSQKSFLNPAIIGNDGLTYSALITCHHAGIKPIGIFASEEKMQAPWFFALSAKLRYGVPTRSATKLIAIHGKAAVEQIEIEHNGIRSFIICDGVILSGKCVPETALIDGKKIDVVKIGNVNQGLNTADRCVAEARIAAEAIAKDINIA